MAAFSLLCSFLIVALHVGASFPQNSVEIFAYRFMRGLACIAVPYFCVASGFFLAGHFGEPGWWNAAVAKRVKSLVVPFFFWNAMAWLFYVVLSWTASKAGFEFCLAYVRGLTAGKMAAFMGLDVFDYPLQGHYWYVRMLFLFVLISPLFVFCRRRVAGAVAIAGLLATLVAFDLCKADTRWSFFWEWTFPVRCLLFLSAGIWLRHHPIAIRKTWGAIALALGGALLVAHGLAVEWFPEQFLLTTILLLVGCWAVFSALGCTLPPWATCCSFPIFTLHWFVTRLVQIFWRVVGKVEESETVFACYAASLLSAMAISFAAALLMRKCWPRFSVLVFGR